jgi:acetyl-CoA carboxylase carboxyl transferase subunit alpha
MREAAEALRLTAQDLKQLGVIDRIIPEPLGGAHRDAKTAIAAVGRALTDMIDDLAQKDRATLIAERRNKFLDLGDKGLAA